MAGQPVGRDDDGRCKPRREELHWNMRLLTLANAAGRLAYRPPDHVVCDDIA